MNQKNTIDIHPRVQERMHYETFFGDVVTSPQQIKRCFRNVLREECGNKTFYGYMINHSSSVFTQDFS